jgi:hypothetical protein
MTTGTSTTGAPVVEVEVGGTATTTETAGDVTITVGDIIVNNIAGP